MTMHNIAVMNNEGDRHQVKAILQGKNYPIPILRDFHLKLIVDVGAYVGATALYFRARYPDAHIVCFEPFPESYSLLVKNVSKDNNIETFPFGLLNCAFRASRIYRGKGGEACTCSLYKYLYIKGEILEDIDIIRARDALAPHSHIDLLKIDTEGCEFQILDDLVGKSISLIMLEFHSEADRIAIDSLLSTEQNYHLIYCKMNNPHRGVCYYLSHEEYLKNPEMEIHNIRR